MFVRDLSKLQRYSLSLSIGYWITWHQMWAPPLDSITSLILPMPTMLPFSCLTWHRRLVLFSHLTPLQLHWFSEYHELRRSSRTWALHGNPPTTLFFGWGTCRMCRGVHLSRQQTELKWLYCRPDMLRRVGLASSVMSSLQRIWKCSYLSTSTKVHMYQALMSVLL